MATILGLLLVVTFLATYLSTTLPSQMSVNDLNHDLLVQNQVGRLSTMAGLLASVGVLGGQTFAPISLGSDGDPPFAGQDSAAIGPLSNQVALEVNYTLSVANSATPLYVTAESLPGAGFVVSLRNTYAPSAEVAYDEGAVVFAQPGGVPEIVDPPSLALSAGVLSVMVPVFKGAVAIEAGTGTAVFGLRLVADQTLTYPTAGYSVASGSHVVITIISPYAAAWMSYFKTHASFASTTLTCTGANNVCSSSYAYEPGGPLGKIVMSVPSVATLTVTQAYFAVTLA